MELDNGTYFVSGIDTDAGKSYVTAILARRIIADGKSCITQKFIQTGGENTDIELHREIMGIGFQQEDKDFVTSPYILSYPASPHLAARIDGVTLDLSKIDMCTDILRCQYDIVLVEGAGGLCVPIDGDYLTADYVNDRTLPIIFVTSGKLGSINHTLLSLEVCRTRGIEVSVVAYNHFFDSDKIISYDTLQYLRSYVSKHHPNAQFVEIESI